MNTTRRASQGALPHGSARGGALGLALWLCAFVLLSTWSGEASAYTWMIRHSYTACSTCHADPSGGELLTQYGRVTADMILRMQYKKRGPDAKEPSPGMLWGLWTPPDALLLSGAYRNLSVLKTSEPISYSFIPAMQADLYGQLHLGIFRVGGSIGLGRSRPGSTNGRLAQVTTNDDGYNLVSRTYFMGFDLGQKWLLRGGRINQPFGLRIPEHNAWVREATRTDRESDQQVGVTLSYVSEKLRGEIMAIAGNYQVGPDAFRERGYSMFLEGIAGSSFASGVSSKVTFAEYDMYERVTITDANGSRLMPEQNTLRQAHGIFGRWAPAKALVMMAELDALFRVNADAGYVAFGQMDYEPVTGLHFILTGEILDQGRYVSSTTAPTPGKGEPRFGGWLSADWFFFKQMEMRVDAMVRQDDPFTLLAQLHLYL